MRMPRSSTSPPNSGAASATRTTQTRSGKSSSIYTTSPYSPIGSDLSRTRSAADWRRACSESSSATRPATSIPSSRSSRNPNTRKALPYTLWNTARYTIGIVDEKKEKHMNHNKLSKTTCWTEKAAPSPRRLTSIGAFAV